MPSVFINNVYSTYGQCIYCDWFVLFFLLEILAIKYLWYVKRALNRLIINTKVEIKIYLKISGDKENWMMITSVYIAFAYKF